MPCRYCYSQCILYCYTHCHNYRQTDEINFKFKLINKKYELLNYYYQIWNTSNTYSVYRNVNLNEIAV